ncbi:MULTISPECIES: TonB-dependent receptor [unclassified Sphingomonas]|uniref:TonB-dependent receptor n=1 Tax=unclassified Sphingomonas TaxID=196159 RepID=UPI000E71D3F1|nr:MULTISPECIES: TonB-dependent receptor [unclassified Sphingomonas]RKE53978.1 outer membrane receptor protein involved in Fe transport [Sphingomonas sp. PP-CC-1A-547]TCM10521.1 outer membrane receptor protein involved in Fe transport [Sphingomonas sp. PP-CC-3G-468]
MRGCLVVAALAVAAPAQAGQGAVDLPAGRLGDAVLALGRQSGTSIVVGDPGLWARRVPAVRGRMTAREALDRLATAANADVVAAGAFGWRLTARTPRVVRVKQKKVVPITAPPAVQGADIVVTGSKRDVRLRDFAGQVALLDGVDLALGGAGGTEAILARLASVSSTHLGAGRNKLFIRGIADSSFTGPTQTTVGQYFGDLRLSYNAPDPDLRLYDIASVEVLEGPQGTLYGAGSLGGIIRTVPNAPELGAVSASIAGGLSATWHGDPGADLGATLNVPLGERVALRVVGYGVSEGGYIDNPVLDRRDVNRTRIGGGRAALRLDAGNGWTVDLGGIGQWTKGDDSQYADRDAPPLTRSSAIVQGFSADYTMGQVVVSGAIGGLKVKSSTGIVSQTLTERYDATLPAVDPTLPITNWPAFGSPLTTAAGSPRVFAQRNATDMIANETRVWRPMRNGFGWVVGGSYTHNRTRLSRSLGPVDAPAPVTGVTNSIDEATLYGEGSLQLVRGLTATAGARVTRASLAGTGEDIAPARLEAVALARSRVTADRIETSVLPSASLIAAVLPKVSLYGRYQQGFRPGGLAIESDFVRRFENDRVRTLESGVRFGLAGVDRAYLTASVSHTIWQDIQADFIDATGLPSTANIGDGRIWTFSAMGGWKPVAGLTLDAGFTYNDSRVTEPSAALFVALARMSQVPNIARYAGRLGADYRRDIGRDLELRVYGWARYVGRSRLGVGPVLGEEQGDYLDTALTARIGRPALGVTLGVTNLTDSVGNRFALGTPFQVGSGQITPQRPRTIRIGLDAAF